MQPFTTAMQFHEIIALPSHVQISVCGMSCADNAIPLKSAEKLKTVNILLGTFYRDPLRL